MFQLKGYKRKCTANPGLRTHLNAAFTRYGKDDPFHSRTGNYECVVFKCFCCQSETKHGGPTDPDLLLLKRSKVISCRQLVHQNVPRALQWKLRREGAFINFHVGFCHLP